MITPIDIENKKFGKQIMNGYNVEEVDEFLDEIMEDYERNYKELTTLNAKVEELTNSLNHYRTIETTLQNTLVTAQTTAEEVKNVAKQQAEQVLAEARNQADEMVRNAKENSRKTLDGLDQQIIKKENELEEMKKQFDIYKATMESLINSQLELINGINKDIQ